MKTTLHWPTPVTPRMQEQLAGVVWAALGVRVRWVDAQTCIAEGDSAAAVEAAQLLALERAYEEGSIGEA